MFAARGIIVAFIELLIVYCSLSLAVMCVWRRVSPNISLTGSLLLRRGSARRVANFLFALRMFPLVAALAITGLVTVPSFLLLEPRQVNEPLNAWLLALGVCAVTLVIYGVANAIWAARTAARSSGAGGVTPVVKGMIAFGFWKPRRRSVWAASSDTDTALAAVSNTYFCSASNGGG